MMTYYLFDILGRFAGESETETERCTDVKPYKLTSDYNWNGVNWVHAPNVMVSPIMGILSQPTVTIKPITHYQFTNLCQEIGGMTDTMLVAAKNDESLSPMWIKFDLASEIMIDDPNVMIGLNALESLGYLPNGANSVIENWPRAI